MLASGWRWIASTTARSSLNQLATLSFSTLSMTLAISLSLTGAPLRQAATTSLVVRRLPHRAGRQQRHVALGPDSVPTGVLELALASTVRTSSSEMLRAAAATGSTWTRTANFCEP